MEVYMPNIYYSVWEVERCRVYTA